MTRIFWDFVLLISSLLTFGAVLSTSAVIEASISTQPRLTAAPNAVSDGIAAATDIPASNSSLISVEYSQMNLTTHLFVYTNTTSTAPPNSSTSTSSTNSSSATRRPDGAVSTRPVKKFVAAAVRSHFDDCPDSHQHFCFHGTCRFLILEETPACVCHPGFVGLRCEHADLLAVVATNHRQQTVATVLVLCVVGCVLIMVLCSLLHCWWRQDCRRHNHAHHYVGEKHGTAGYPSESVV
ncbi:protransforming growth factor alpha [Oryzias melastigma]|uniref:Transforming growth factor, alpha n=1 Tax=Oryzias melastigma TaxID=30732 RepID=A0A3B3D5S2_ORYME|nr:protransforming growth factor alpha [Oryzias melastigma]